MTKWVARTYTYSEPADEEDVDIRNDPFPNGNGPDAESATVAIRGASSKSDFDAGFDAGYRAGWTAGYGEARHQGEVNYE